MVVEWSQALRFHPLHYPECKSLKILKRVGKPLSLCTATMLETGKKKTRHIPPPVHTSIQSDTCFSCVAEYAITSGNTGNWRMWQWNLSMPTWQMVQAGFGVFGASFCCNCVLFLLLASTTYGDFPTAGMGMPRSLHVLLLSMPVDSRRNQFGGLKRAQDLNDLRRFLLEPNQKSNPWWLNNLLGCLSR